MTSIFVVEVIYEDAEWAEARYLIGVVSSLDEAKSFADAHACNEGTRENSGYSIAITHMAPTRCESWRRAWYSRGHRHAGSATEALNTWTSSRWTRVDDGH